MFYQHERDERKVNTHPICTKLPKRSTDIKYLIKATDYLKSRNLSPRIAHENGWFVSDRAGDSFPRLVIPAVTHKAGHIYWQARDITGAAYFRYQSPPGPRHEALVVVQPLATSKGTVVVEGPMDALAAAGVNYTGIALMGMHPSIATLEHLSSLLKGNPAVILLDRDSSNEAVRIVTFLAVYGRVFMAGLPGPEKDLAACLPLKRRNLLKSWFKNLSK